MLCRFCNFCTTYLPTPRAAMITQVRGSHKNFLHFLSFMLKEYRFLTYVNKEKHENSNLHASGFFRRYGHIFKLRYENTVCQIFILQSFAPTWLKYSKRSYIKIIVLKYSVHAMWFGSVLGQHLWQLSRLAWKHKNVNITYLIFILEGI